MSILGASFYLYETHDEWNEFSREEKLVFNDTQNKPLHQAAVKTVELGLQELKDIWISTFKRMESIIHSKISKDSVWQNTNL